MAVVRTFSKKRFLALLNACFFALSFRISQKIPTLFTNPFQNPKPLACHFLPLSRPGRDFSVYFPIFPTN